jgi:4-hydroxy-tetrahydrodipicolinate reductase
MGEVIAEARGTSLGQSGCFSRQGMIGPRPTGEIGIQSVRAGDVVGDHTVIFAGQGERIELTHRAHNRNHFAIGALRAAKWIVDQPPGLYTMRDVLKA